MGITKRKVRTQSGSGSDPFHLASGYWDRGDLKRAFGIFLKAAKDGDVDSQVVIGYFYDEGLGVRANAEKALYWYTRAYKRGDSAAANNIAIMHRDRGNSKRALSWFGKALQLGDEAAALRIAEMLLTEGRSVRDARNYLRRVLASDSVSEASQEKAQKLLWESDPSKKKP